ncbi:hypothetical protein D3C71_2025390 [compost metagenome]
MLPEHFLENRTVRLGLGIRHDRDARLFFELLRKSLVVVPRLELFRNFLRIGRQPRLLE